MPLVQFVDFLVDRPERRPRNPRPCGISTHSLYDVGFVDDSARRLWLAAPYVPGNLRALDYLCRCLDPKAVPVCVLSTGPLDVVTL